MSLLHTLSPKLGHFAGHLKQPSQWKAGELCFHQARHLCKENHLVFWFWRIGVSTSLLNRGPWKLSYPQRLMAGRWNFLLKLCLFRGHVNLGGNFTYTRNFWIVRLWQHQSAFCSWRLGHNIFVLKRLRDPICKVNCSGWVKPQKL